MATATLNVYSHVLGMNTDVGLIFPERRMRPHVPLEGRKFRVLYLLHGGAQDHTSWMRSSRIEWYLRDQDVVVVMPSGHRGFYTDGKHTHRYFTYLTEELPVIIKNWFAVSGRREPLRPMNQFRRYVHPLFSLRMRAVPDAMGGRVG